MPTIKMSKKDLLSLSGAREKDLSKLPMMGVQVESIDGDQMEVEVEANRSDMFSVEGIARHLRGFLGIEKGFVEYTVENSDFTLSVDESVRAVRPYIGSAYISGLELDDFLIKSIMAVQEKLHTTVGRKRKKIAIGIHDSSRIGRSIIYKAVRPDEVRFEPLGMDEELDLAEILERHDKGREYAWVLDGKERYPILMDTDGNVLSFPPIINGNLTLVTPETKEVFLDVTGTDMAVVSQVVAIIVAMFADRGGKIHRVEIRYPDETLVMPDMSGSAMKLDPSYVRSMLGTDMDADTMVDMLEKARFGAEKGEMIDVRVPSYRYDLLHQVDLVEEIAISYGYDSMGDSLPKSVMFGRTLPISGLKRALKESLIGLGFNEIMTLTLTNEKEQFVKMGLEPEDTVEIENPVTEFHTSMRKWLLPSMMAILNENRHRDLPQRLFETGIVVDGDGKNRYHMAAVLEDDRASFTAVKSLVQRVMADISAKFTVEEKEHPSFIAGRCASILMDKREIGFFGEIAPPVLSAFEIEHPVSALEIDLGAFRA